MTIEIIYVVIISISGFFGKSALEKTGGLMIPLGAGVALASHSFSWRWVVAWVVGLFIGWAIVVIKEVAKEESGSSSKPYIYTSTGDGFSVSFPKKPQIIDTGDYSRQYISNSKDAKHSVTVYDLADSKTTKGEIMAELRGAVSRVSNLFGEEPDLFEAFEIDGLLAVHTSFEGDNNSIYYYAVVVKDDKLYDIVLSIIGENDELFVQFVNSFKLIKK